MIIGRGNLKYSPWERLALVPVLSITNTTWHILGLKTGLSGVKTVTILSCDNLVYICYLYFRYLLLKNFKIFFSVKTCDMVLDTKSDGYKALFSAKIF